MIRYAVPLFACAVLATPVCAQQGGDAALQIEQALERCNDGIHAIEDASVAPSTITFRAGPRDVLVFFGPMSVSYAEVGGTGGRRPREARLLLSCAKAVACVWSGPWSAAMAAARAEHGIVPLDALPVRQASLALYCPDLAAAQAMHKALLAMQRPTAP
ncbi:MAG: hypothetical protein U1E89_16315 [Burkholderiaceae bacterium]